MESLAAISIGILRANQRDSGAFIACPDFPTYRYSWFRDGAFCALALAEQGYGPEAWAFLSWGARVILRYREKIRACVDAVRLGRPFAHADCFHSRFTADGREVPGNWGHHQLDGLGTWLWAAAEIGRTSPRSGFPAELAPAQDLAADYLMALWPLPCSDCWEENESSLHTYSLAAISAGLRAYARTSGDRSVGDCAEEILAFIRSSCVRDSCFVKSPGLDAVDANLLGLFAPYGLVEWEDPIFGRTIERIEAELCTPGLHRYRADRYYGGGEWVLLTAWLGLAYARAGKRERALELKRWVEAQASDEGYLPEQVPRGLFAPQDYAVWLERWGAVATPLLWSHAQYLLLAKALS